MKALKRISALVLVLMLMMSIATFASASSDKVYTTGSVNLRRGPGLEFKKMDSVPEGIGLRYTDTDVDDRGITWYKVKYDGKTGWLSSVYASKTQSGKGYKGKITLKGSSNLRKSPNRNSQILDSISAGYTLKYYDTAKDSRGVTWYMVRFNEKTGWVSSMYTDKSSDTKNRVVCASSYGYVRDEPNRDGDLITTMYRGDTAKYLGVERRDERGVKWYKISYDGYTGWISSNVADRH